MPATVKPFQHTFSQTFDGDVNQRVSAFNLNLSKRVDKTITQEIQHVEFQRWKEENREGLQEINRISAQCGHFSDEHRKF